MSIALAAVCCLILRGPALPSRVHIKHCLPLWLTHIMDFLAALPIPVGPLSFCLFSAYMLATADSMLMWWPLSNTYRARWLWGWVGSVTLGTSETSGKPGHRGPACAPVPAPLPAAHVPPLGAGALWSAYGWVRALRSSEGLFHREPALVFHAAIWSSWTGSWQTALKKYKLPVLVRMMRPWFPFSPLHINREFFKAQSKLKTSWSTD